MTCWKVEMSDQHRHGRTKYENPGQCDPQLPEVDERTHRSRLTRFIVLVSPNLMICMILTLKLSPPRSKRISLTWVRTPLQARTAPVILSSLSSSKLMGYMAQVLYMWLPTSLWKAVQPARTLLRAFIPSCHRLKLSMSRSVIP
jgi:hypothetical protein